MIIASASAKSSHHGGTENTEKSPLFQAHSIPRAWLPGASGGSFSGFPSSDSHDLVDPRKENLPVSDLPRKARLLYRIGNCLGLGIFHHRHEIHLGNKIDVVFSPAVDFHVPFLASESLHFADGHPLNAKSQKGLLDLRQTKWFNDCLDFQGMFAIITPALISGAIAERMKFSSYLAFILLWSLFVYDPLAHWIWGGGWLAKLGVLDFAGGLVVHLSSGLSALAIVQRLGKRKGYPSEMFVPHNLTLTALGVGLLWFGWFDFNAGSALAANASAALAFANTMIAGAATACSWMMMEWWIAGKPSALGLASGIVAGLASVTPAAGYVTPAWALFIGLAGGAICFYGVRIKFKVGYDDSLDVVGVHGMTGIWGPLATGLFASIGTAGLVAGNAHFFNVQVLAVAVVGVYSYGSSWLIGLVLDKTMGLRVGEEEESLGLDRELHGEVGYSQ